MTLKGLTVTGMKRERDRRRSYVARVDLGVSCRNCGRESTPEILVGDTLFMVDIRPRQLFGPLLVLPYFTKLFMNLP